MVPTSGSRRRGVQRFAILAIATLFTGCYFYYPKRMPEVNGTLLVEGERIEIVRRESQVWIKCISDAKRCVFRDGEPMETKTWYYAKATYNGRTLTRAEFNELTIPDFAKRVEGVRDRKGLCKVSLIPSVLAVVVMGAAAIGPAMFSKDLSQADQKKLYIGGAAAGGGLALLSFPLGGFACVKASSLAGNLNYAPDDKEWRSYAASELDYLEKAAAEFNARRASTPTQAPVTSADGVYRSPRGKFTIELPGTIAETAEGAAWSLNAKLGLTEEEKFVTCSVAYFARPSGLADKAALDIVTKGVTDTGTVLEKSEITLGKYPGRSYVVDLGRQRNFHRYYVSTKMVYLLMCGALTERLASDAPLVNRTLDSFKVTP